MFQLLTLNGTGNSLSADWVGRALYWLEETSDKKNAIMKYDLYQNNGRPEHVTTLAATPGMMVVAPLTRYWSTTVNWFSFTKVNINVRIKGFSVRLWNMLKILPNFRCHLKTYLYNLAYPP